MEETSTTTTTKKKPLSLNQRYNHLVSASHSRPLPRDDNRSKLKVKDDDAPHFSFSDVDSSPDVTSLSKEKEFGTQYDSVEDELVDDDLSQSSEIADVDPPIEKPKMEKVKIEGRRRLCKVSYKNDDDDDQKEINTQDSSVPVGKSKPEKVKIEGRRRLCKVSSESKDNDDDHQTEESHQFYDVSDYSSPLPGKDEGCGGNDIRNILDDLSSRLDFLSIEKKRNPKPVDMKVAPMGEDLLQEVKQKGVAQKDGLEDSELGSAGSSLAALSDLSSSSSGVNGGVVEKGVEVGALSESDGEKFYDVTNTNAYKGKSKDVSRNFKEEPAVSIKNSMYNIGNSKDVNRKIKEQPVVSQKKSTHDISKLKNVSRKIKEEPIASKKKSPYDFKVESDEDEDDCVEVGRENFTKRAERHGTSSDKENDDSGVVEVSGDDDDVNEVVSKDDFAITFSDPRSTYKLPPKIGKMLYPHQREGLKWLWSLHCKGKGGILGDDMGLGKTMQISGFLAGLFSSRLIKRAMIVAPKTLMPHWIKELTAVGLSDKIKEYYGTCPKLRQYELQYVFQNRGILLTTYDIVRFNEKHLHGDGFYDDDCDDGPLWDYMVLDEGHLIKNPSTQRAKSLLGIPCAHRIIISGTPIQNNLKELWALFNFCCPDLLGDHKEFKETYEHPILRGNDKKASERDKRVGSMVAKELRERIQPYFLRRLKSEVFCEDDSAENSKLSKKNEIIVWLRLTSCQRQLYEAFLKSEIVLSAFDGSPLAAITILKKICDHPYLLTKRAAEDVLEGMDSMLNQEDCGLAEKLAMHAAQLTEEDDFQEKHDNLSCKISFILSLLNKLIPEGHNVLIFSQTRKMLNLIQESLYANGFEFLRIDGTTKATDRLKIVDKFQEGRGPPIFLLTSQVGGLGLTLTNADRVIVVDPAWNPSTDNQSVDRAYRIGQKKDVIVYRLMTCSTIEEKIYRMQIYKGGLFKTATEHKEQTRYFSQQDLKELFSLPKDGFDVSPTQLQLLAEHGDQITLSDDLKAHIKFLESLGIGGVSHHSLLYSKTEPTQAIDIEEDEIRRKATNIYSNYGSSSTERYVDGSQFAFNPKDVNRHNVNSSPQHSTKMTESDIKERMNRLSQILSNKATVARLPDSGEKIRKQLTDLSSELEKLETPDKSNEVIDLDDLSDSLQRSLNV